MLRFLYLHRCETWQECQVLAQFNTFLIPKFTDLLSGVPGSLKTLIWEL